MHSTASEHSSQPLLQPSPSRISELSQAACDYVQRATGLELDSSEDSLAFADHYLRTVQSGKKLRPEVADLVAAALGVYLGELLLSKFGGRWLAVPTEPTGDDKDGTPVLDSIDDPLGFRVQLHAAPLICDPVLWARQALLVGSDDDTQSDEGGLVVPPSLQDKLHAAMARLPPVSEEYYFSFTGRFETVCYLVELLASLLSENADDTNGNDGGEAGSTDGANIANPH